MFCLSSMKSDETQTKLRKDTDFHASPTGTTGSDDFGSHHFDYKCTDQSIKLVF